MARRYNLISADSHLEIAPTWWTPRVPAAWRDRVPRLVTMPAGGDGVVMEGRPPFTLGLSVTGKPYEEHQLNGIRYEDSPGTGTPEQRVQEQDMDGVDAEVMFTSIHEPTMWRALPDEGYLALLHAYNEWLAEDYAAAAPDRLFPMGMIPTTGVNDAIREMEYCKKAGLKGVTLVTFPNGKTYPTPEDDRFWQAALDMPMPIAIHVKFLGPEGQIFNYPKKPAHIGQGDDPLRMFLRPPGDCCKHFVQLMFAGVFDRFPNLRLYSAETLVGWMPCALERIDDNYNRTRYWMEREFGLGPLAKMPSEYILNHGRWGFLLDKFGVRMRHEYGVQNAMWGSDFPHGQGDWPQSHKVLDEMFVGVPEDERYAMVAGNAVEYFGLDNEA